MRRAHVATDMKIVRLKEVHSDVREGFLDILF